MAITTFADVKFDTELFTEYVEELSATPDALISSGILRADPIIQSRITEGGTKVTIPSYSPLSGTSQNYDGTDIVVNGITSKTQSGIILGRANAWGSDDLSSELATKDPTRSIAAKVAKYWQEENQRLLLLEIAGFTQTAKFLSDKTLDITVTADPTEANKLSATAIIDAAQKSLGDNFNKVTTLAVHSLIYASLLKQNLITFVPLSAQSVRMPVYMGYNLIVDDTLPVTGGAVKKYTTLMFGAGVIGTANGNVKTPVATERDELKAGGSEWLVNRTRKIMHPYGFSFEGTPAKISPADAELSNKANWAMVYDNKNIAMAAIITNG